MKYTTLTFLICFLLLAVSCDDGANLGPAPDHYKGKIKSLNVRSPGGLPFKGRDYQWDQDGFIKSYSYLDLNYEDSVYTVRRTSSGSEEEMSFELRDPQDRVRRNATYYHSVLDEGMDYFRPLTNMITSSVKITRNGGYPYSFIGNLVYNDSTIFTYKRKIVKLSEVEYVIDNSPGDSTNSYELNIEVDTTLQLDIKVYMYPELWHNDGFLMTYFATGFLPVSVKQVYSEDSEMTRNYVYHKNAEDRITKITFTVDALPSKENDYISLEYYQ